MSGLPEIPIQMGLIAALTVLLGVANSINVGMSLWPDGAYQLGRKYRVPVELAVMWAFRRPIPKK